MSNSNPLPCGTRAAYKRHLRHGERACAACRAAESAGELRRREPFLSSAPKEREIRDPVVPYRYRARRYRWAEAVLEYAESVHGRPDDEEAA